MADSIRLEVFVASPGDVPRERQIVRAVLSEIEQTIGESLGVSIHAFFWEHDLGPGVHIDGPQGLVDANSNLATCDVLVGIFWNRLGTPTADGTTGTEHEVLKSFARWQRDRVPAIMLYFSRQPIEQTKETLAQGKLLLDFRDRLPKEVFAWQYADARHFERMFREQFTRHVLQVWNARGRPSGHAAGSDPLLKLGMITSSASLIQANADIVSEAEEVFYATGSRSRDVTYLSAIEARLKAVPALVHHRVLMGPPYRNLLKTHLRNLVALRPPEDRSQGFKTLHIGLFNDARKQAETFIAGNEKRALIVLPSRKGLGEYNTALLISDSQYVADLQSFVKQLYAASQPIETADAIDQLTTVIQGP